jgi:hypothetical protein
MRLQELGDPIGCRLTGPTSVVNGRDGARSMLDATIAPPGNTWPVIPFVVCPSVRVRALRRPDAHARR